MCALLIVINKVFSACHKRVPTLVLTLAFGPLNYCLGGLPAQNGFDSLLYTSYFHLNYFGIESILKQHRRLFKCFVVL